ncbi:MAG: hypothetical protein MJY71_07260 [Bacteroidaceae bacterium]|nr:hypothetical protein [Bacteroidaceae bacterium]
MKDFETFIHAQNEKKNAGCTIQIEKDVFNANAELCLRLYHEITEDPKAMIRLDSRDFEHLITDDSDVYAYEFSIDGTVPERMTKLVNMMKGKTGSSSCPQKLFLYFFTPPKNDLTAGEMEVINDWIDGFSNDMELMFGIGINKNSNELRIALLLVR